MKLHTDTLFEILLRNLKPQVVCDVGSKDGYHARRFRTLLPHARVVAFEANPPLAQAMQVDAHLSHARIEIEHKAVCHRNGTLMFNVEAVSPEEPRRQEISSTRKRLADSLGVSEVRVEATRLDTYFKQWPQLPDTIALWIDAEGGTFEVLEGMEAIRDRVDLLQVEVETTQIWLDQKLKPDVQSLLAHMGFIEVARGFSEPQHDLIFVSKRTYAASFWRIRSLVILAFLLSSARRFNRKVAALVRKSYLAMDESANRYRKAQS